MSWFPSPEYADWWYDISWKGIIGLGTVAAIATAGTVVFTVLQFWSDGIRDKQAEERQQVLEAANAEAQRKMQLSQERIAQLEKETAEANRRAEEDRLARLKIESKLKPRVLSKEQAERVAVSAAAWTNLPAGQERQSAAVFSIGSSFEGAALAGQITSILSSDAVNWKISRNPVMYGKQYSVLGVGILTSSNERGIAVANSLAASLSLEGVATFVMSERRPGCEERNLPKEVIDGNPFCSAISIIVGERP